MAALHYLVASVNVRSALLCLIVFLILTFIVHRHRRRIKNLPPGPRSWPVFGCLPELVQVKLPFHELFCSLAQKYGPVCYLSAPFGQAVVISGYDAVHESLTREEFNWKSPGYKEQLSNKMFSAKGILLASGDPWKEHRKFSLTVLRGFGVGKRSFEDQIASESEFLMHEIKASNGKAFDPSSFFYNAVSNVICSVVFGRRFEYNDLEFTTLLHLLEDAVPHLPTELFLFIAPFLSKIPFFPKGGLPSYMQLRLKIKDVVNLHRDTYDEENMRDFIDVYLKDLKMKTEQGVDTYLCDDELVAVIHNLFFAGTETTSITLRWSLLYMLKYPYVQKRVQEEIDSVVGRDRLPKLSDKPNLPYTEAVIHEIQRFASIAAITGLRYNRSEVEFRGYTIPKGTHVISNLYSVTRDPSVWVEPDSFQPERFLDDDKQFKKNPKQMVFGAGKRVCLGKQLAVMELFIFYTHLMHRFSFHKPDGMESVDIHPKARGVLTPYPYNICAVVRECM
ncbi:cytochrome P450 2F3-like isoform X1 [Amphiura filiformis]|uniref:cytochrome P450 2F3-like isoform X1 n=1 Tax=Amphiura filiformis TaxID=82378 RepID=UPI003B21B19B